MTQPAHEPDAAELAQRLARSRPRSGRAAAAKLGALRVLERLERERTGLPEMPPRWHPAPDSQWAVLDAHDPLERRERWWQALNQH